MSSKKAARKRKKVGYEHDVPACDRCKHFRGQYMELRNSVPQWHPHRCTLHEFDVAARGCCDSWECKKTGTKLEK